MEKHWIEFLPEAGRIILMKAENIKRLELKSIELCKQMDDAIAEKTKIENSILNEVRQNWSQEEMEQAQYSCDNYNKCK